MTSEQIFDAHWAKKGKRACVVTFTDTRKLRGAGGKGFANARPSDRLVTFEGRTFYAEVKSTSDTVSFSYSNIQPIQIGWAKRITKAGGEYYFFVHSLHTDQWFKVPAEYVLSSDKRSAKFTELTPYIWTPEL